MNTHSSKLQIFESPPLLRENYPQIFIFICILSTRWYIYRYMYSLFFCIRYFFLFTTRKIYSLETLFDRYLPFCVFISNKKRYGKNFLRGTPRSVQYTTASFIFVRQTQYTHTWISNIPLYMSYSAILSYSARLIYICTLTYSGFFLDKSGNRHYG